MSSKQKKSTTKPATVAKAATKAEKVAEPVAETGSEVAVTLPAGAMQVKLGQEILGVLSADYDSGDQIKQLTGQREYFKSEARAKMTIAMSHLINTSSFDGSASFAGEKKWRAEIAKGTIYLYFRDKESLFQELVRAMLSPLIGAIEAAAMGDLPIRAFAERIFDIFVNEIFGTRRKDVIRLIITEGPRFPQLAELYYREVIARVLPLVRQRLRLAVERGELASDALERFPQLLVAPGLIAIIWSGLFERFAPLDVRELMRAHLELLFGERVRA
jgi:AcrR family transcriptional regulator